MSRLVAVPGQEEPVTLDGLGRGTQIGKWIPRLTIRGIGRLLRGSLNGLAHQ